MWTSITFVLSSSPIRIPVLSNIIIMARSRICSMTERNFCKSSGSIARGNRSGNCNRILLANDIRGNNPFFHKITEKRINTHESHSDSCTFNPRSCSRSTNASTSPFVISLSELLPLFLIIPRKKRRAPHMLYKVLALRLRRVIWRRYASTCSFPGRYVLDSRFNILRSAIYISISI